MRIFSNLSCRIKQIIDIYLLSRVVVSNTESFRQKCQLLDDKYPGQQGCMQLTHLDISYI